MTYEVNIIWASHFGTDRTYHIKGDTNIRDPLLQFLRTLHLRRSTIVSCDDETIDKAHSEHPEIQEKYDKRRQALLENLRIANFPALVYLRHKKGEALNEAVNHIWNTARPLKKQKFDLEMDLIKEEAKRYHDGEDSELFDFTELDQAVKDECEKYTSLAELVKTNESGHTGNTGIFFPRINDIDQNELNEIDWHVWIGRAAMDLGGKMQYIPLDECLKPNWEITPQEIAIPVLADGKLTQPGERVYVALGFLPNKKEFVRIANDLPPYGGDTISRYNIELWRVAWKHFQKKMNWA